MKAYLCMNPVQFTAMGLPVQLPDGCVVILGVYKTKEAARAVSGKNAVLAEVNWPIEKELEGA